MCRVKRTKNFLNRVSNTLDDYLRRTWAEIDLDAAAHNYAVIRAKMSPDAQMCCVVKADAYGHGAVQLAKLYERLGASWLAVSNLEEAAQLRDADVHLPILILGYTPPQCASQLGVLQITQTILSEQYALALDQEAAKAGVLVHVHIKLDTGMSRIGFLYQDPKTGGDALDAIERVCSLHHLIADGIFTHFAVADEGDAGEEFTCRQFACFTSAIDRLADRDITFKLRHCANSAAISEYPSMQLNMCRPGVILYGMQPSAKLRHPLDLWPVMSLKSTVSLVKTLPAGTPLSYGCTFRTDHETRVATIAVGYADGYPRLLSNKGAVLLHGKRAPILGRVCMDQMMVDVTAIPDVAEGDTAVLMGTDGEETISAMEIANIVGTINYEITCNVSKRVPRLYIREGREVGITDLICQ